jgi:hypothetical protein
MLTRRGFAAVAGRERISYDVNAPLASTAACAKFLPRKRVLTTGIHLTPLSRLRRTLARSPLRTVRPCAAMGEAGRTVLSPSIGVR